MLPGWAVAICPRSCSGDNCTLVVTWELLLGSFGDIGDMRGFPEGPYNCLPRREQGVEGARSNISASRLDWGRGLICLLCSRVNLGLAFGEEGRGGKAVEKGQRCSELGAPQKPQEDSGGLFRKGSSPR